MARSAKKKKKPAPRLEDGDLVVSVCDDAAYMGLVDIESYEKDLADWDYASFTRKIVEEMNAGRIVAWGCPEVDVNVRLTLRPLGKRATSKIVASTSGTLSTTGSLCLAGYSSLTMCAQFKDEHLPQPADDAVRVQPGTYRVDVHRLFAHRRGEQFPDDDELPEGDHYVVVLTAQSSPGRRTRPRREVAWAPKAE